MAVTLRLSRWGVRGKPFYRIVAAEKQKPRDGRFLDIVGTFNPMVEPNKLNLLEDKVKKWLAVGARPTDVVRDLIKRGMPGLIEEQETHRLNKIKAQRKARKTRAKSRAKK